MRRAVAVVSLMLVSSAAHAQGSFDVAGADRETVVQLARIIETVKAANLPTDPLVAKASLAVRFRKSSAQTIAAVQSVAEHLQDARDALGATSMTADITAGADALSTKGVTKDMLQRIRTERPGRSIAVPIGVMAQLVASGVSPKDALDVVARLVRANASNAQLVSLGNDVSQDVRAGAAAASALQIRSEPLRPLLAYGTTAGAASMPSALTTSDGASQTGPPRNPPNPRGRP